MTPTTCHRSHQQQKKVVLFFRIKRVCNHKIRCGGCLEQFKTLRHKAAVKQDKALNRFFFLLTHMDRSISSYKQAHE